VSQGQGKLYDFVKLLQAAGVSVKVCDPSGGRPYARANGCIARGSRRAYDLIVQLADVNEEFKDADVALVIGANDVVNPEARNRQDLADLWHADSERRSGEEVLRGQAWGRQGLCGIVNPLFYADNTFMVYGDAAARVCLDDRSGAGLRVSRGGRLV